MLALEQNRQFTVANFTRAFECSVRVTILVIINTLKASGSKTTLSIVSTRHLNLRPVPNRPYFEQDAILGRIPALVSETYQTFRHPPDKMCVEEIRTTWKSCKMKKSRVHVHTRRIHPCAKRDTCVPTGVTLKVNKADECPHCTKARNRDRTRRRDQKFAMRGMF